VSAPGPPAEPTPPGSPTLVAEPDGEIPLLEGTGLASSWADLGATTAGPVTLVNAAQTSR
jgi:hypothetical protein